MGNGIPDTRTGMFAALLFGFALLPAVASGEEPYQVEWIRPFGTDTEDIGWGVAADASGVYVTGETGGNLGVPNLGRDDAFVRKYDANGGLLWSQQLGTDEDEQGRGVTLDASGNVYITGLTNGDLAPGGNSGIDLFVAKYNSDGASIWTEQYGPSMLAIGNGISADRLGSIYITGRGGPDGLLAKYDEAGAQQWVRELTFDDRATGLGVSADQLGNVFVSGFTEAEWIPPALQGDRDVFLAKYDAAGMHQWTREMDHGFFDVGNSVAADGFGNVYVSGAIDPGSALLAKYDTDGDLLWSELLNSGAGDEAFGVAVDDFGNAYVAGRAGGNLGTTPTGRLPDAFVAKYAPDGDLLWTQQFGSEFADLANAIALDDLGNVFVTGVAVNVLSGSSGQDVFVAKLSPVPEPGTVLLAALGALGLFTLARRRAR